MQPQKKMQQSAATSVTASPQPGSERSEGAPGTFPSRHLCLPTAESIALSPLGILQKVTQVHTALVWSSELSRKALMEEISDFEMIHQMPIPYFWKSIWNHDFPSTVCVCSNVLFSYLKLVA